MIRTKVKCQICGQEISKSNLSKHLRRHENHPETFKTVSYTLNHDGLICQYCGKECKNRNSLSQHERMCKQNPNHQESALVKYNSEKEHAWNFGLTKENNESVAKQAKSVSKTLKNRIIEYKYSDHKNAEINKWLAYIDTLNVDLSNIEYSKSKTDGYYLLKNNYASKNNKLAFVHNYIASILLAGVWSNNYSVHHINKIRDDNSLTNLMIFETKSDHTRFHKSESAYLVYNQETHLFSCYINEV